MYPIWVALDETGQSIKVRYEDKPAGNANLVPLIELRSIHKCTRRSNFVPRRGAVRSGVGA